MDYRSQQAIRFRTGGSRESDRCNMLVFMDLNVCSTQDRNHLRNLVEKAATRECPYLAFPPKRPLC